MRHAKIIGNFIQKTAKEKHISTKQIADTIFCTEQDVHRLYEGEAWASYHQLEKIASLLGVTITQLLEGSDII